MEQTRWYKDKVFYQIWPRSFCDGNGDGVGDLIGVYEKLDYIKSLGCDGIWFSPLYPSPGVDCGYDVSDYMDIDALYGGMDAFKRVLDGAHERGMKVIMDLVVNHTSDEHEWFQKSRRRIEPYTDYYIWRPAGLAGKLPNNWDSAFEGKAWQWDDVRREYYLHLFAIRQPDLNMDNPLVRQEVKRIMRFWLDLGVDGFREDVITFISKRDGLPNDYFMPVMRGIAHYNHGPRIHLYLEEFKRDALSRYDCYTIGEAPLVAPKKALDYINEETGQLNTMIQFQCMNADCFLNDYVVLPFSARRLKRAFDEWQEKLEGKAWNMLYLENHDHPRVISRYGSEKYRVESGKMLAAAYLFQKGTPFVYQGQEIGMINWRPEKASDYEDVQTRWHYENMLSHILPDSVRLKWCHRASRDSSRTPMQWSAEENAGFTTGTPWFSVNDNYREINVAAQENDPNSLLNFYRDAIMIRKRLSVVRDGDYVDHQRFSGSLYVYSRTLGAQRLLVICSFVERPVHFKAPRGFDLSRGELLLKNYGSETSKNGFTTKPYECRVYYFT
ncbi:MAG: alpha-glucosidase [Ruminococcaceae bacterium]|jgi:oligo-1,6-glucosidase|nr:alpha-glucosidase [Oscillospiraceae bacterium]